MILPVVVLTLAAVFPAQSAEGHFDPKGKLPSQHTIESQKQQRKGLPFADDRDFEELTVDGVRMVFRNMPGTEAPAEINTWFPDLKAFRVAENITATIHNIYTLCGVQELSPEQLPFKQEALGDTTGG